jgi:hypothetical protein
VSEARPRAVAHEVRRERKPSRRGRHVSGKDSLRLLQRRVRRLFETDVVWQHRHVGYYVSNGWGESLDEPTRSEMEEFVEACDEHDEEHGDVWMEGGGWTLSWSGTGVLTLSRGAKLWEHLVGIPKSEVVKFWMLLAEGRVDELQGHAWRPGARPPMAPEEIAEREARGAELLRQMDREFYSELGEERADVLCRQGGCARGAISHSVFCRPHHFASVKDRPSPFDD